MAMCYNENKKFPKSENTYKKNTYKKNTYKALSMII